MTTFNQARVTEVEVQLNSYLRARLGFDSKPNLITTYDDDWITKILIQTTGAGDYLLELGQISILAPPVVIYTMIQRNPSLKAFINTYPDATSKPAKPKAKAKPAPEVIPTRPFKVRRLLRAE